MSILIKGMEMPTTGLYFVSVDNTGGRDKTVITVERMLGNRDIRQIVGSFELVPVLPHGDLIDKKTVSENLASVLNKKNPPFSYPDWNDAIVAVLTAPTIIPAEEDADIQKRFLQNWHEEGE